MSSNLWRLLVFMTASATSCKAICDKIFDKSEDRALKNHVISSHNVTSALDCAFQCLQIGGCKSYNYQETGSPLHLCELNNHRNTSSPFDYVTKPGFTYYVAEIHISGRKCAVSPCQNGGTCIIDECTESYECLCGPEYVGEDCETWMGNNGSSSSYPGHSCLNIKLIGQHTGDGIYWIRAGNTGNPFTVYCDMTTHGGGWTQIVNFTAKDPNTNETHYTTTSNYRDISELGKEFLVSQFGLLQLKKDMGFTQLRYYCRKASVGRVFHIMTARNELGYDAVRYLIVNPSSPATACDSFIRLADDQSILAATCLQWGYQHGVSNTNSWGHSTFTGPWRPYNRVALWLSKHSVTFYHGRYTCDDSKSSTTKDGDNWKLFVR